MAPFLNFEGIQELDGRTFQAAIPPLSNAGTIAYTEKEIQAPMTLATRPILSIDM